MSEWISVKERLPEPDAEVLAIIKGYPETVAVTKYLADNDSKIERDYVGDFAEYHNDMEDYCVIMIPTHWMPLPEPPNV